MGEIVACGFVRVMKGEEVVIERDFERKEADGDLIARKAERRMRCLVNTTLARILCRDRFIDSHCCGLSKEWTSIKLSILSPGSGSVDAQDISIFWKIIFSRRDSLANALDRFRRAGLRAALVTY